MKKKLAILLCLVMVFALAACGGGGGGSTDGGGSEGGDAEYVIPDPLIAGAETTYAPFEYAEGDEIVGFDVDLWKEIGNRLGVEAKHESFAWDGLISGLMSDKFNVIMSCMGITDARLEQIDFSIPYFYSSMGVAVNKNAGITSLEECKGKIGGVQTGTTTETWLQEHADEVGLADLIVYDTITDGIMDLQAGRIECLFNEKPNLGFMLKDDAQCEVLTDTFGDKPVVGIGVSKNYPELTEAINKALLEIAADGTYAQIYEKWFGVAPGPDEIPGA